MVGKRANQEFAADNRAVSAVIGFILIFGILVLLLTVYQAQIVPQQNAQTEFEHFEDSQNELIELRNAISTAGQADVSQFPSVTLGTNYQTRLFTINPPPPAGTLQTSEAYPISIENESGDSLTVETRFLEYQPGYNELRTGPIWYEHSVLYLDERERSSQNIIQEQQLVTESGVLRLTALQNEFQQSGTGRVTLELYSTDGTTEVPDGELTVEIPTRLNESDYWGDAFEEDPNNVFDRVEDDAYEEGVHNLTLTVDDDDLEINTVGIRTEPNEGPIKNFEPISGSGGGGGGDGSGKFDELDATLETSGGGNIDDVVIDLFEMTTDDEVTFTATEGSSQPDSDTKTDSGPSGDLITLDLGGGGNNEYPVEVTANIGGGECLETTFEESGSTSKSLTDWEDCSS